MFRRLLAEEGETWETVEVQRADPPSDEVLGSYDVRQLALHTDALPCTSPQQVPGSVKRCSWGCPAHPCSWQDHMHLPVCRLQMMSHACGTQQGLHMQTLVLHMLAQVSVQGLVITGSAADSFAQEAWIMKLRKSLTAASERRQRILAICFGHQLMSIVLGGMTGVTALRSSPGHPAVLQPALASGAPCLPPAKLHPACHVQHLLASHPPPSACVAHAAGSRVASFLAPVMLLASLRTPRPSTSSAVVLGT